MGEERALTLRRRAPQPVRPTPEEVDGDAVPSPHGRSDRLRGRLSQLMYADEQPLPDADAEARSLPEGERR